MGIALVDNRTPLVYHIQVMGSILTSQEKPMDYVDSVYKMQTFKDQYR